MRGRIINIALPSGATFFLDVISMTVAMLFIGRLGSSNIAALGIGLNYIFACYIAFSTVFYTGTNSQCSRLFGARELAKVHACFSTMFFCALLFTIPMIIAAYALLPVYLDWMSLSPATFANARAFTHITVLLAPIYLVKNVIISALSAIGNTRIPFYIKIVTTCLSILLSYALILGIDGLIPRLGIQGAAITNVTIALVELFILIGIILSRRYGISFSRAMKFSYFSTGLRIGIPSGVERMLAFSAMIIVSKFLANFGDSALAGNQIGERIESFCFMPGFGFMVASMSLVGQSIGAKNIKLAREYTVLNLKIASVIMGVLGVVLVYFAKDFSAYFSTDASTIRSAQMYLYILGISQIPLAWVFILDGVVRGSGKTLISLSVNCGSMWLLRILPMWLLLINGFGYEVIYACISFETFLRAGIYFCVYRSNIWYKGLRDVG